MKITGMIKNARLTVPARSRRGQSMVEFSIVLPLFMMLVFGAMDFSRLLFTQMAVQHAIREAGRLAVTGRHLPDPSSNVNPPPLLSRVNSIIEKAKSASGGMDVSAIQISSKTGGTSGPGRAGGPNDTVTISMTVNLHLMTPIIGKFFGPSGIYTFVASTTFKNEPFNPGDTQ